MQEFSRIAEDLVYGSVSINTDTPEDLSNDQLTFQTGVVWDGVPLFKDFGDVAKQAKSSYNRENTQSNTMVTGKMLAVK